MYKKKDKFIYCRVSSSKQMKGLKRQVEFMQDKFPEYHIITDVGIGINFKRKGFNSLLQKIFNESVSEVVVASNDRLCRLNYEFIEWLFLQFGCKLLCHNKEEEKSSERELSEDIISIITVITERYDEKRKYNKSKKD